MGRVREYESDRSSEAPPSPHSSPPRSPSQPRSPADSPPRSLSPVRDANEAVVVGVPTSDADTRPSKRDRREGHSRRGDDHDEKREKRREEERERERERRREKEKERREREKLRREEKRQLDEERRKRDEEKREERRKKEEERRKKAEEQRRVEEEERREKARLAREAAAAKKAAEIVQSSKFVKIENVDRSVSVKHLHSIFAVFDIAPDSVERVCAPALCSADAAEGAAPSTFPLDEVVLRFPAEADADVAVRHMNGGFINGRRVRVKLVRDPKDTTPAEVPAAAVAVADAIAASLKPSTAVHVPQKLAAPAAALLAPPSAVAAGVLDDELPEF